MIDSIAAAFAAPWLRPGPPEKVGLLHQRPGGIDHGPFRTRVQAWLDARTYPRLRFLLVASQSLADEMRGIHPDIRVLPPGRDVAGTATDEIADLRHGRRVAFLCAGNWIRRKGIVDLVDAFARLPAEAATLHLVGDVGVDPRYTEEVRSRLIPLGDRVVVHGVLSRKHLAALYRDADAFVMPSYKEPYGTVYGEAMAAGLPVVGWRAGNLPYLIENEREGFILEPGDVEGLAATLQRLSEDDGLRTAIGDGGTPPCRDVPYLERDGLVVLRTTRAN